MRSRKAQRQAPPDNPETGNIYIYIYERLDLPQRVVVEAQRSVTDASTRLGAGVEAEGVVAELRSLVDRRYSRRG